MGWRKGIVEWADGDTLYLSVPFTWLLPDAEHRAMRHRGRVVAGGPAVKLMGAAWADETPDVCPIDALALHNPDATFTTRGCPNACAFCAVPRIEGAFRELPEWKPAPIICDNNIMAASRAHFERVIDSVRDLPFVDFNQGLDARLFTSWHAGQIARLKKCKVRFALDHANLTGTVKAAIDTARAAGLRDFGVYVLFGFKDTPDDALHRLETVRSWGIRPTPMRFQPLDALKKNAHVAEGWTQALILRVAKYYSRLRWYEHIPFESFRADDPMQAELFAERAG